MTLDDVLEKYRARPDEQQCWRLGQWFMNNYMRKATNPRLFYAQEKLAKKLIEEILTDYQW